MLKKLTNLLFEDEVDDIEEEEEYIAPVVKKKKPIESRIEKESIQEPPVMKRIDVTQPLPKVSQNTYQPMQESGFKKPVNNLQHASPRPITTNSVEEKPKISLSVDEVMVTAPVKPNNPVKPISKPNKPKVVTGTYEFQPVISPIFGIDDKDLEAVSAVRTAARATVKIDSNVSKIISPIYGISQEVEPTRIQNTLEKPNELETVSMGNTNKRMIEEKVPDFSLDDILKIRDEEYDNEKRILNQSKHSEIFPALDLDDNMEELIDETVILDRRDLNREKINKQLNGDK